ncbi:MAG TPA: Nramp family divalent metal transporter [Rudaea sp.]|nr:Nramp family divalent metal transporter [Rudaea sp.]
MTGKSDGRKTSAVRRLFGTLGPGVVTGAADDDPSGIATYSIAGAQFGNQFLWAALLTWPLMGAVQMMSARVGMVSGRGLAGAFRQKFPRWLTTSFACALFAANTINIASDLSAMSDAVAMLVGGRALLYAIAFGVGLSVAAIRLRYRQLALALEWLALALFAYVATAFLVHVDWADVAKAVVVPALPHGKEAWATLVAILGTTISPYLFYWQAGQEIEEQKAKGRNSVVARRGASRREIDARRIDVGIGTFFSNVIMFFIIVTTAATLHKAGHLQIETTRQAAEALRPLGGQLCYWLFAAGLIGTGLLAIPTLAGSAAYAFAETFGWNYGLDKRFHRAPWFYGVFVLSTALALGIDAAGIDPMKALFWSAVINGVLAPLVLVCMYLVSTDRDIMAGQTVSRPVRIAVGATTVLMAAAAIGLCVF